MNHELSSFAARLRGLISHSVPVFADPPFAELARELFNLQFQFNPAYQIICRARGVTPEMVTHWTQIPAVPTSAFKELELSSIPPEERTAVFHSSGTTEQKPSRHFHQAESLAVYETSLMSWFKRYFAADKNLIFLTPGRAAAPHSSLIYMFETIRRQRSLPDAVFTGSIAADGTWILDFPAVLRRLQAAVDSQQPLTLLGTAFSFVHLLDYLAEHHLRFELPAGSRVMETGGYKNRSRTLPKTELHQLITERIGVHSSQIICEYGMSELSSQAYAMTIDEWNKVAGTTVTRYLSLLTHHLHFPPWARAQIVSPETGREVADGLTGIIRVFDLANVYSVAAVQTEDLGIRRGEGFELIGRAEKSEPRGCSLMTSESVAG